MTRIGEAVALLTNNNYDTEELAEALTFTFRFLAYNFIGKELDKRQAEGALFALETLIDGLKGKFTNEQSNLLTRRKLEVLTTNITKSMEYKKIEDAIGVLTNDNYNRKEMERVLDLAYRSYAYNHVALDDNSYTGQKEALECLTLFGVLLDGVRGEYVGKK